MALPTEFPRPFGLYVTHVDSEGHFLKISGQLDKPSTLLIEHLFEAARENLEQGIGSVIPSAVCEGLVCAAKYKDGSYYRAKVINTSDIVTGMVGVHFIDFGNKDFISLSAIRFLDKYDPLFLQLRGQATDYYLSRVIHPAGQWDGQLLLKLQNLLCYAEYFATIDAQTRTLPIISIQFKGTDLSSHLVANRFGVELPVTKQEVLLAQMMGDNSPTPNWPSYAAESQAYTEHVPFLVNQNFPSNPASAMRLQQNTCLPFNSSVPPPSLISQRLLVNKVSRTPVSVKAPMRQPQNASSPPAASSPASASTPPQPPPVSKPAFSEKHKTYKSRLLEVGTNHKVFVSFAEKGPEVFAVQLVSDAGKLQEMMDSINRRPHSSLAEPPMIGTVCLGRMSGDRIICRAVVMNLSGSQCQLYFVDFGDTEMVSYYDIFDIPEEFVKPNVFALRFCLSGVKKLDVGTHLTETFKQLVVGKVMTLRVVQPEGPPLMQYGELYLEGLNILDLLLASEKDANTKLQFKTIEMLPLGSWQSVMCSYVDSCLKFYLQLSEHIDELNTVMDEVKAHCESSTSPGELPIGAACCALFPEDNSWYRAKVLQTHGSKVSVSYVDYGNEQEVNVADLRTVTPSLTRLPAQALKCALKGFENKPVEIKSSNQLEMLALEKTLNAHIVGVLSSDTMLVSLVNESESPPLDIARKMNELSTPQAQRTAQQKATTPSRKDAPESFSSPEDGEKKGFRREKSFRDERRSREGNDEFGQRGGSFRARDNNEGFDRSAPGRHSDKFGGRDRPEKGDRRGPKPWEKDCTPAETPLPSNDDWDETPAPAQNNYQRRDNRDGRDGFRNDRRNRPDPGGGRANWKSRDAGAAVGKRLRQAAEAATTDTRGYSVQDRLKRDNKFNHQDEKKDEWGHKNENRPDRRGDRKDNWGERKDFGERRDFGERKDFQKREFRDNNRERGDRNDRPRSNFTPRDRADRSFGSNKSDKSQDAGRAPPYKSRSKFTEVQYKELSDPVPLETPFQEPVVEVGAQHEVSVTWIISPESFFTQIMSLTPKFLEMMNKIPELYKGVKSYTGMVPIGASVLARYPADGVLYRATVVAVQPFSKFIVRYIDFGNKQLVDAKDIWQLDNALMELPKMAVHCSLLGVAPKDGEWKANNPDIDLCFNAPRYQCVFQEIAEEQWKVYLYNNGVNVADMLVEKELAVTSDHQSSIALKDEAIDLTIIVGQQMLCKVTHVVSFDKFYIQLDLDKAALVEEAIANFDATKLTPLTADSLAEGVHCTVRHEEKIYRAILNDVTDPQNIQAVLPDYGMSITTSIANLMILPTELSVYYYQSLNCTLNNYTAESNKIMTEDELRTRLQGNKFIIYINDVYEINLVSTLYDIQTGKKVAIFEPDEGAFEEVIPLCTRAVFNYNFGLAYISHAESFNELYLQKSTDTDKIAVLLDELFKFYEEGTPEPLTAIEADALCAAKSSDGNWYRATVTSVDDHDQVKVQYTDYGNSESVSKDVLKVLDPKFYEPCALALVASLGLVHLQDDALPKLLEWTTDKELQVTLACGAEGWLASLHLDGVDLSMKLVNEKLATPQVASEEKVEASVEPMSLPTGCTQSYISHIDTPGHFWLQMADKVDTIEEIQAELQANADSYADIENREMGTVCVAKYLADDQWYRAEILDADADITTVRFIDYGNTDVLDNQPGLIKTVPDKYTDVERYAVKSSVNAIPTGTGEWSEQASEYFTQLVGDTSVPVETLIVLKDVTTYVDLFVNGENLTDKLVSEGYATKSEAAECGDLPSCFASHVNSPSEFWIQLETATPELQAMEAAMVNAENFPELSVKEEGVICAAKYPEDGAWYRAQVIVDGSEGTEVLFMDYGNASIANELRSLPDELKTKPALSRKCALQKPRDIKAWSRKSEVKFNELAAEGATIFNVQFIASGDISIVELLLDNKSVTEVLVALCDETPVVERPTPVGQDMRSSGKICYVNSLEEFYVQLDSSTDLDKIFERLSGAENFETCTELKVGSICAAFWAEDEQWYRAKVLELCDVGYHVQFIDFGNKAKCEEFRQLPEDVSAFEPQAKCCRLAGLEENSANESMKAKLDELAADPDLTFQIEFLDSTKEPALVKLLLDGKDLLAILAESGAVADAPKTEDNEVAPTGDNEVVPTGDNEVVPTGDNEVAPTGDSEVAPTGDSEVAPTGDSEVVQTGDNVVAPTGDNEVAPLETVEVALTGDSVVAPTGEKQVASSETVKVAPTGDNVVAPETVTNDLKEAKEDNIEAVEHNQDTAEAPIVAEIRKNESGVVNKVPEIETEVPVIEDTSIVEEIDVDVPPKLEEQESIVTKNKDLESKKSDNQASENAADEMSELNVSNDLDESVDSSSTVIENKSFEGKTDTSSDDFRDAESPGNESTDTLEKSNNESTDTLEKSNDTSNGTVRTTERDESKESLNTDTGYTSEHEYKISPIKDENVCENTIILDAQAEKKSEKSAENISESGESLKHETKSLKGNKTESSVEIGKGDAPEASTKDLNKTI